MKILQMTQNNLATIGVGPSLKPYNSRVVISSLLVTSYIVCTLVFVAFEAKAFTEYTQSVYMGSSAVLVILSLIVTIWKKKKMFSAFNDCEILVDTKPILNATVQFERTASEIVFFVAVKLIPACVFVPWIIYVYFVYFTTDAGTVAFELPFPMWYVTSHTLFTKRFIKLQ